jgi:DNA-directed RNA polymerase specialized sigma24 family protein
LLRYAGDIVGSALARDVVQDTFLKLCAVERARVEAQLAGWLFTVCRNGALEVKRRCGGSRFWTSSSIRALPRRPAPISNRHS